jgi:S-adenosyl-L-methionine hydrolase (adenosine-forming)
MAIITFMSDFGHRDSYVAAVKAKIYSINPNINIVDLSHEIEHFNLAHAAFVLRSVFRDFPKGTVHLVSVHAPQHGKDRMIAMKVEEHYFVGIDNGLFSLVTDKQPTAIVELIKDAAFQSTFPEKTVLSSTAVSLASGISIYNVGKQITEFKQMLNRMPRVTKEGIYGSVIHIDNYGNLITNISKEVFDKVRKERNYAVSFAREMIDTISESYESKENADCVVVFNSFGLLEIAISQGSASGLLGLGYDSQVKVNFV